MGKLLFLLFSRLNRLGDYQWASSCTLLYLRLEAERNKSWSCSIRAFVVRLIFCPFLLDPLSENLACGSILLPTLRLEPRYDRSFRLHIRSDFIRLDSGLVSWPRDENRRNWSQFSFSPQCRSPRVRFPGFCLRTVSIRPIFETYLHRALPSSLFVMSFPVSAKGEVSRRRPREAYGSNFLNPGLQNPTHFLSSIRLACPGDWRRHCHSSSRRKETM